ncbi:hypothetical protein CPB84DRAFT_1790506, partial [Gymnopilus junonius]
MYSYNPYNVGQNDNAHGGSSHQHQSPQNGLGQLASPAPSKDGTILIGTPPYSSPNSAMNVDRSASSKSLKLPASATSAPNSRKLVPPEFGKNWGHPRQDKTPIDSTPSSSHTINHPSLVPRWNTRAKKRTDSTDRHAASGDNGATQKDTAVITPYPQACGPIRHRAQSARLHRPVSPRLMPRDRYPQPPSPFEGSRPIVTPFTIGPPPTIGPCWGWLHEVQSATLSASMNVQQTMTMDSSRQYPPGTTPLDSRNFSPRDHSSSLHQGELAHQKLRCHQLLQTGWQTSSQQVERNRVLAGYPGESYEEEYEPLQYPAQRGDATRKRKYDASRPIPRLQNRNSLLDPSTEILPPSNRGYRPPLHDLESAKEAESLARNTNQDEDMLDGSSDTTGKEEEQGPERVPDSDPFWALTGIPKPSIPREFFMALESMSEAEALKQKE